IRPRRISTMKEGVDKEKEASPLRDVLIHERHELQTWKETVEIRPPNLLVPRQIASHVNAQPLCKLAVSPKGDHIAVMSHRRTFQMFRVTEEEEIVAESSVQILEDANAEYCIFEFSASGTLLLSTRSDASIDVFDRLAEHCYTMMPALPESSPDLVSAISSISSYSLMTSEDKFSDYMASLHYNCTLSAYKMGRSSYFKLFTVLLESPLTGVCRLLPSHGMCLVTTHYRIGAEDIPGGLASYRIVKGTPHVVPVVAPKYEKDWWESLSIRLPFASSFAYISSLAVDATESHAVGVSTTGDIFLFGLPSLSLLSTLTHVSRVARPRAAVFVHSDEVAILFSSGRLIRCSPRNPDEFVQRMAEGDESSSELYSGRTQLVVPTERELFVLQSEGGPEVAISSQRSSLAARLFMLTIWRSLKNLLGMAVGDAAAPLQQATQLLSLEFSLWHAPIVTLEELLERTMRQGNFARAIQLADTHPEIEKDSVYKRQWMDVCESGRLTRDDVKNILGRVRDLKWKAERCLLTTTSSLEVQRELVREGIRLHAPLPLHVRLAHHGRLLAVMEDVDVYLEMREWPLEKVAEGLAERGSLVALERLLVSNWSSLGDKSLDILASLPSSIEPKRYSRLVPTSEGKLVVGEESNDYVKELTRVRQLGEEERKEVERVDRGEREGENEEREMRERKDMEKWAESRARTIETETGIVPYAIQMIELCKERGCKTLDSSLIRWKHLDLFIRITRNVLASLDFLQSASVSLLGQHFAVLDDSSLISSLPSIIDLLQWHSPKEYEAVVRGVVTARTTTSTRVLHALIRERPELVDGETMMEALSSLTLTGPSLLNEIEKVVDGLEEGKEKKQIERVKEALRTLEQKNVHPTFGKLIASQTDGFRAREVLAQLVHCNAGERRDENGWRRVADDVLRLARMLYADLLSEEEAMEMVAERFLLDADLLGEEGGPPLSLSTLLTVDGEGREDGRRLNGERSAGLLLRLADSFIASSVSGHDEQLGRARVLADAAKGMASKESAALIRSLDIIGLAADLGSGRLPIQIKHADPLTLLEECIGNGDNYKRGKRCAKLAQLLRVDTPVATAFASCALLAVERGDEQTLAVYIQEISSARNLPVVYTLCMRLLATPLLPHLRSSIEACAVANAGEEELEEVLGKISSLRLEMEESLESEENDENERDRRRREDGRRGMEKEKEEEKRDHVPLDPYYTKAEQQDGTSNSFGDWRKEEERFERRRRGDGKSSSASTPLSLLAAESASAFAAAAMLSAAGEAEETIEDERLRRFTSSLRHLLPRLSGRLVEGVTPRRIIERAIVMDEGSTALDRLEAHGCSRERFVEDVEYRLDTIDGLAMMEDSTSWSDAVELAAQFGIDESRVHLASIENILTTLSPSSARSLISLRGHREVLRKDGETTRRVEVQLRRVVLPLLKDDDDKYLLYLEQFSSTSTESVLLSLLIYLREHCGVDKLHSLLHDESRLARAIERVKSEDGGRIAEWLREIPGTSSACEAAARSMLAEKADPQRFLPLIRDPSMLIELLGDISIDLEGDIDWLLQYPQLPSETRNSLKRHRDDLFGGRKKSEERREESPTGGWGDESGGMGGG
ncbi:hypothetical protein PFISCL1PPCAC_19235, partial [Pristionchus fissidentatus]